MFRIEATNEGGMNVVFNGMAGDLLTEIACATVEAVKDIAKKTGEKPRQVLRDYLEVVDCAITVCLAGESEEGAHNEH